VRRWSIVGALALVLAFSSCTVSAAFAQTPVAGTTAAAGPDDPKADGEQPKPEKPKPEEPAAPSAEAAKPKPEEPKATEPKPTEPKPKVDEAKVEKPKAAPAPKPTKPEKPKPAEPKAEKPKPAEPKAEKPKPAETPKPAEPKPTADKQPKPDKPKAPAGEPVAPLHVAAARSNAPAAAPASATRQSGHAVAGSRARHVGGTHAEHTTTAAPDGGGVAGAVRSDPAPVGTAGNPGSATHATGRSTERATTHAARLAPNDAARAAAPSDRRPIRALPLDAGPSGYDLTLLLTIVFTAGVAYLIGRETRRLPRAGARR
jgi:ribonuclease E